MNKVIFNNLSYLNNYKVFCFSDIYLPKHSSGLTVQHYCIGDYIPTSNFNYIYGSNILVIDYFNKVVHVIIRNIYCEIVKITNSSIEIDENSYFYKLMFENKNFKVIDIYGNFLKVSSIEDLMFAIMTYPQVEISLIENKYLSVSDSDYNLSEVVITDINVVNDNNLILIKGDYNKRMQCLDNKNIEESFFLANHIKDSIFKDALEAYKERWFHSDYIMNKVNDFLLNIRLLYLAVENDIKNPFTYFNKDIKYATHIGKISRFIKDFLSINNEEDINIILDIVFSNVEFGEEYEDFIISTLSISIDNLAKAN